MRVLAMAIFLVGSFAQADSPLGLSVGLGTIEQSAREGLAQFSARENLSLELYGDIVLKRVHEGPANRASRFDLAFTVAQDLDQGSFLQCSGAFFVGTGETRIFHCK